MRPRQSFAKPEMTQKAARAQLKTLLAMARSLDSFTPEQLARTHKLPLKECTYELTIARQNRAARG